MYITHERFLHEFLHPTSRQTQSGAFPLGQISVRLVERIGDPSLGPSVRVGGVDCIRQQCSIRRRRRRRRAGGGWSGGGGGGRGERAVERPPPTEILDNGYDPRGSGGVFRTLAILRYEEAFQLIKGLSFRSVTRTGGNTHREMRCVCVHLSVYICM